MAITAKDFIPEWKKGGVFKQDSTKDIDEALSKMNEWIDKENPDIIQIETVLLPNIHDPEEHGSHDADLWTSGNSSAHWYQFVRVWYRS